MQTGGGHARALEQQRRGADALCWGAGLCGGKQRGARGRARGGLHLALHLLRLSTEEVHRGCHEIEKRRATMKEVGEDVGGGGGWPWCSGQLELDGFPAGISASCTRARTHTHPISDLHLQSRD